ncbi:MAG: hypothetical protein KJO65_05280 [Gemmatimonadetes bacterium]|nr:hypothetical protein [Gemmatimonadota bacterium]
MSFHLLLALVVVGAAVQIARMSARSTDRVGEAVLVWVLVGYCGVPMIAFMAYGLMHPMEMAGLTGFEAGSPFQTFTTWALMGMGVAATAAFRYRGTYLMGPALAWAIFFVGATSIHFGQYGADGTLTHDAILMIFATHGLISVLLLGSLWASGVWKAGGAARPE